MKELIGWPIRHEPIKYIRVIEGNICKITTLTPNGAEHEEVYVDRNIPDEAFETPDLYQVVTYQENGFQLYRVELKS